MKETFYFSHDYNSRSDEKIVKLLAKEDWYGFGVYWALVEKLYEAGGYLDYDCESIAYELRTECERIARIINDYGLFAISKEKFYSKSVLARLSLRKGKSEKARQSAVLRWNKPKKENANALRTQSEGNAIKESKGKESKGKEILSCEVETSLPVNKILDKFYEINPGLNYGSKPQRDAVVFLLKKIGEDKLIGTIDYYLTISGDRFAPVITTPLEMKSKLGQLINFYNKSNSGKNLVPEANW